MRYFYYFQLCLLLFSCSANLPIPNPTPVETEIAALRINEKLPFVLVYGGLQARNAMSLLEQGGFSHLALGSLPPADRSAVPPSARAILWTGVANGDRNSPWAIDKSPWGNDLAAFVPRWTRRLAGFSTNYGEADAAPAADFIVLDIESERQGEGIEQLRTAGKVPADLRLLSKAELIARYEQDMRSLAAEAVQFLKDRTGPTTTRVSSYGDVPISRNWYGIPDYSWQAWQTDATLTNFLGDDGPDVTNPFAAELNVNTPSAYYFFPTGQNLAYALFQIEANKSRSKKELILFITPRYVGKATYGNPIEERLAEATAIFSFFSGANGLWLWETSADRQKTDASDVIPAYRGFFRGVERLSHYVDYFQGDYRLVISESAHSAYVGKKPVWRGVVKGANALVAAQNPYAKEGEVSLLKVAIGEWSKELQLEGDEVFLQEFRLR